MNVLWTSLHELIVFTHSVNLNACGTMFEWQRCSVYLFIINEKKNSYFCRSWLCFSITEPDLNLHGRNWHLDIVYNLMQLKFPAYIHYSGDSKFRKLSNRDSSVDLSSFHGPYAISMLLKFDEGAIWSISNYKTQSALTEVVWKNANQSYIFCTNVKIVRSGFHLSRSDNKRLISYRPEQQTSQFYAKFVLLRQEQKHKLNFLNATEILWTTHSSQMHEHMLRSSPRLHSADQRIFV